MKKWKIAFLKKCYPQKHESLICNCAARARTFSLEFLFFDVRELMTLIIRTFLDLLLEKKKKFRPSYTFYNINNNNYSFADYYSSFSSFFEIHLVTENEEALWNWQLRRKSLPNAALNGKIRSLVVFFFIIFSHRRITAAIFDSREINFQPFFPPPPSRSFFLIFSHSSVNIF